MGLMQRIQVSGHSDVTGKWINFIPAKNYGFRQNNRIIVSRGRMLDPASIASAFIEFRRITNRPIRGRENGGAANVQRSTSNNSKAGAIKDESISLESIAAGGQFAML